MRNVGFLNVSYGEDYAAALRICREYRIGRIYESLYLCRRWPCNTDAALSIEQANQNDAFKDRIRTTEILARQEIAKSIAEIAITMRKTKVGHMIGWKKSRQGPSCGQKFHALFNGGECQKSLTALCLELLVEQKKSWLDLREGCGSLKNVRDREISCRGFSVRLQYNPGRIKSSLARVGEEQGKDQRCFLCLDHLPEGQKGILHRGKYLILCNPMPVFSSHFTVSHVYHRPQAIADNMDTYLQLMADFGSGWMVLYNGPKCGASAPDHLHFQAIPSGQMPIEDEILEEKRLTLTTQVDGVLLYRARGLGREVIILEGDDRVAVGNAFKRFLDTLKTVLLTDEEPMMNIAGFHKERKWSLVIFPRQKHRPDTFFMEGNARVVVSPGVIDMGGVMITPVEKDFDRLDAASVESIYREMSLDEKTIERAIKAMTTFSPALSL